MKVVCREHGIRVGGCDCGDRVMVVKCPCPKQHDDYSPWKEMLKNGFKK